MKNLKDYICDIVLADNKIKESVLSDMEDTLNISDDDLATDVITKWINDNWIIDGELNIKFEGNTRVVDCNGTVKFPKTGKITNGLFVWGNIANDFIYNVIHTDVQKAKSFVGLGLPRFVGGELNLHGFKSIVNLEGLPDNVGSLSIYGFTKLNSLKGCSTYVKNKFSISGCPALKGLDYLPKHIGGSILINHNVNLLSIDGLSSVTNVVNGSLYINGNYKLKSLEGCPSFVDGNFDCEKCKALTSLSGCPEQVKGGFSCKHCATRFKKSEVESICRVSGNIDAWVR